MQIDRRITNGLAWAGVVLVIGVPVADVVSAQLLGDRTPQAQIASLALEPAAPAIVAPVPATRPVTKAPPAPAPVQAVATPAKPVPPAAPSKPVEQVAVTTPVAPVAVASPSGKGDVVDSYLSQGKPLPSYITGGQSAAPTAQASAPPLVVEPKTDPVAVAALPETRIAPVPMPLSMRPAPRPGSSATVTYSRNTPQVVIPTSIAPPATVTADDLQDWESGPLSEFLARRQAAGEVDANYDADGFFLDEGPNGRRQRDRLVGPVDDYFFPFVN